MKLWRKILCGLLLPLAACSQQPAAVTESSQPLQLTAVVDNARPATNDDILYTVTVDIDDRLAVELPQFGAAIAGLRIIDAGHDTPLKGSGRTRTNYWYKLRADISGVYLLPAVEVNYARPEWFQDDSATDDSTVMTAKTAEIFLEVASRIGDGSSLALRSIKPLPPLPPDIPWTLLIILLVAALVAVLVIIIRRRQREEILIQRPAHEIAYDRLAVLLDVSLETEAGQRDFFYKLSAILKEYLENRFAINTTDMTTEEVGQALINVTLLDDPHRRTAISLLKNYDLVKYAGILVDKINGNDDVAAVKRFIDDTRELTADQEEE